MTDYPVLKPIGDSLWVAWPGFTIEFSRLHDARETITCELSITADDEGHLHWSRINLASTQGRRGVSKALEESSPTRPWREIIEQACRKVILHLRTVAPLETLTPAPPQAEKWFVEPVIPTGEVTVLFGDGGTGKSLLALALGIYGVLGHQLGGWRMASIGHVLYLDWETDARTHQERLWGLTRHLEVPMNGALQYRRLSRPLLDVGAQVKADADRSQADLIICDSLAPACGLEPEGADAAVRTLMALRELPGTKLVIAHVSKAQADQTTRARPFGSVFVQNLARSVIEARRSEGLDDEARTDLTLYHRKSNNGRLGKATGLSFSFDDDGTIHATSMRPDLQSAALSAQILRALVPGRQTGSALSDELGANRQTVKTNLQRLEARGKVIRFESVSGGRGKETLWGLKLQTDSPE